MTTLYVANCTKQFQEFHYRVPAEDQSLTRRVQVQRISPGSQQQILGESPLPVLEAIIDQHRPYGLVPADEVVRTKEFVGMCYAFDRPVKMDQIGYAMDHNKGVQYEEGEERREETAAAAADAIDGVIEDARRDGAPLNPPRAIAVENLEESTDPKYGKGFRIDRGPAPNDAPERRTKRTARRAARKAH